MATISEELYNEFFGKRFQCFCTAWNAKGDVKSRPAMVKIASKSRIIIKFFLKITFWYILELDKSFIMAPPSARIEPGYQLELKCTPPDSVPKARLSWQRNGQELSSSSLLTITHDGNLIIHSTKVADSGNYTCQAENIVGKRVSNVVPVVVRSEKRWSEWSMCGVDCRKTRQRNCNARSPDDCQGKEIEAIECTDGDCHENRKQVQTRSDRIVYISLIILSVLCVILAALFAHSKRKKPEIPDYIVTDNGELIFYDRLNLIKLT